MSRELVYKEAEMHYKLNTDLRPHVQPGEQKRGRKASRRGLLVAVAAALVLVAVQGTPARMDERVNAAPGDATTAATTPELDLASGSEMP